MNYNFDMVAVCPTLQFSQGRQFGLGLDPVESFRVWCACRFEARLDIARADMIISEVPPRIAYARIIRELFSEAVAWHRPSLAELTDWGWFDAEASA